MTEVAPLKLRGAVGVLCQIGITSGVLAGQILSLSWVLGTKESWHIMLAAFAPLCLIALGITWILPESPKFLYIIKGRKETAIKGQYYAGEIYISPVAKGRPRKVNGDS